MGCGTLLHGVWCITSIWCVVHYHMGCGVLPTWGVVHYHMGCGVLPTSGVVHYLHGVGPSVRLLHNDLDPAVNELFDM